MRVYIRSAIIVYILVRDVVQDVLLPEAREEYTNVLEDTRHPANKEAFSAEDLRRAREEARAAADR